MQPVVNRALLASIGATLLGAGCLALAAGLDLYRRWDLPRPPQWIPTSPGEALRSAARDGVAAWPGSLPVTLAVLALVVLFGLVWLLRQLPGFMPRNAPVGGPAQRGSITVRGSALARAVREQALAVPGVHQAHVRLNGGGTSPRMDLTVIMTPTGNLREVLNILQAGPIQDARTSTDWPHLPVEVRLFIASHKGRRAC
ncbi:alkaline shock response membrane anchor protein AmaP [Streptomyces sp. NBC_01264]|uniref:alkaline shock response membrane anchor protein AmaP n=1 Tax=Streptomyces sp. NBC_01264 TaxID=2903804 RepID=UPI00224D52A8|nr:alkaline shock response membrane anchor protein AmaP [Streptomyces sp. NBC_01264]MCX4776581.1 alkaline shock response membrane anchor protein AmaP [Streptomyces sp. NBC_01264]